jgi:hypothetical protein
MAHPAFSLSSNNQLSLIGATMTNRKTSRLRFESLESRAMLANSVDIIVVADTSGNMSYNWAGRAIESLESQLDEVNITDVDFALVGFGGTQLGQDATQIWHFDDEDSTLSAGPSSFTIGPLVDAAHAAAGARTANFNLFQGSNEDGWAGIEAALSIYDDLSIDRPDAINIVLMSNEGRNVDLSSFDNASCRNQAIPHNGDCSDDLVATLLDGGGLTPSGQSRNLPPIVLNSVVTARVNDLFLAPGTSDKVYGVDSDTQNGLRYTYEFDPNTLNTIDDDEIAISFGGNYVPGAGSSISLTGGATFEDGFSDCSNDQNHGCTFHDYIDIAWDTGGAAWDFNALRQTLSTSDPNDPTIPVTLEVEALTDGFADAVTQQIRDQLGLHQADFNADRIGSVAHSQINAADIDRLFEIGNSQPNRATRIYDLNHDGILLNGAPSVSNFQLVVDVNSEIDTLVRGILNTNYGDYNLDGDVGFDDFLVLTNTFNTDGGWASGDLNGDFHIDLADFVVFRWSYNNT